ncbi:ShlB/FhaC/HecB family hemolysin secretion/activation protein [Marinomonas sp. M1K-6]|uniref:ShlB/FhaC/HecB family hemolysin secretion/activation protein n=1 Tax=Marinomonas profundi TaxID=2726122 RepID=A0A847RFX8_9GAMM|nr:ShlB/FhaC/HecB family hemolysin secretion/activation protein [Marinomonas profundi]NLQ19180.1 ShlB/FhaC/HecB family hemolysin secretion/activation protein [Marinomonas profundi]UDV03627.1 ShlB/FhaC/HecB family hemolysin secretion/activation protein [Marinomonas profundi]
MNNIRFKLLPLTLCVLAALGTSKVAAQDAPLGAGQVLQQNQAKELAPKKSDINLQLPGDAGQTVKPGGKTVALTKVAFIGNTVFADEVLLAELSEALQQPQDLAGLRNMAEQITNFYRASGYPFARALLPAQALTQGKLQIQIVEGKFGEVKATSDDNALAAKAQTFLTPLKTGEVIASKPLERSLLLITDLPGVQATPIVRPSTTQGAGDLEVKVTPEKRVSGEVGLDNHGSRFSGAYRASGVIKANRLLTVGDQLSFSWLYSSEETWLGGLQYSLPVGSSGLMANAGYAHTDYTLGKGFEGYKGTAAVSSVGLSYPVIRSQQANLSVQATYQYKDLDDKGLSGFKKATASHSLPLQLSFDKRDAFAGGGITYGQFIVTPGQLDIEQFGTTKDQNFTKLNLQVVRLQSLAERLTLVTKLDTQWTSKKDLDGSESFSLGGPQAVRAYPVSEGSASRGLVVQMEMRYATAYGLTPYTFVDAGQTARGDVDGSKRRISGAGLGSSYAWKTLQLDANLAWSLSGGDSQADTKGNDPRFWLSAKYSF